MRFDTTRRRYVDNNGHVVSPARVRREVIDYVSGEKEKTQKKAQSLLNGTISLTSFFLFLKTRVEAWHEVAGSIAYGGKAQLDPERRARIKAKIDSELEYLREFHKQAKASFEAARKIAKQVASQIEVEPLKSVPEKLAANKRAEVERELYQALIQAAPSDADSVTRKVLDALLRDAGLSARSVSVDAELAADLMGATIPSRAGMYADAAYATYQNNEIAREFDSGVTLGRRVCEEDGTSCDECVDAADTFFVPLEDLPEIGSLTCMNNCRCYFETAEPQTGASLIVDLAQQVEAVQ